MKSLERYRLMREYGLTTQYLARVFEKDVRSIRRAIDGSTTCPSWVEDCRRFIADRIDGMTYEEVWETPEPEGD